MASGSSRGSTPAPDVRDIAKYYRDHYVSQDQKIKSDQIAALAQLLSGHPFDEKFYIIGGAAVQLVGSDRITRDIDMIYDTKDAMDRVRNGLRTFRDGNSGFAVMPGSQVVYWYNKPSPTVVILLDMHYASQGKPPFPTMPIASFPVIPRTGVPIAPSLLNLCYKLIAWSTRDGKKKETDAEDILFLLGVGDLKSPRLPESLKGQSWCPAWTMGFPPGAAGAPQPVVGGNAAGVAVWEEARKIWQRSWTGSPRVQNFDNERSVLFQEILPTP
ncbi:MAG: hypothetical protein Q9191_001625 [Dirinaria sp. TL-2023a]